MSETAECDCHYYSVSRRFDQPTSCMLQGVASKDNKAAFSCTDIRPNPMLILYLKGKLSQLVAAVLLLHNLMI